MIAFYPLICTALCCCGMQESAAQTRMSAHISPGEEAGNWTLTVDLQNADEYAAMQVDIDLPAGTEKYQITPSQRLKGLSIASNRLKNGKLRILVYSLSNRIITEHEGALLTVSVKAPEWNTDAEHYLSNIHLTTLKNQDVVLDKVRF